MKRNYLGIAGLLLSIFVTSCDKNAIQEIDAPLTSGAQIKFFNFGVSSPSVNFYANATKISGTLSSTGSESINGVSYGSVFPSTNYNLIQGGSYTFKGQISSTATIDANFAVANLQANVEVGKFYSLYTSGIYNTTTKTTDAFIVEDKLPAVDNNSVYIRFVNTISNAPSAMNLVIKNTSTNEEVVVATNIGYKGASEFVKVPSGLYEVYARYPSSNINLITRNGTSIVSFGFARVYTISSRGDMSILSTTLTSKPFLDNTSNR